MTSPYNSPTFCHPLSLRVDGNFLSTMSLSPSGRDAVLAGRKGLFVIDLDDPFAAPRWLHHETQWEVADVQWSPHRSKPGWVVSTSNQKAMVWNLARPSHDAIEHVLHGHTRAITDINFHPTHPELLATCSVDSFVLAWDLRAPSAPIHQWADWAAAASQVKWNYRNPNILASSHDSHILIWDVRQGAMPLHRIDAHDARVNGIDWSRWDRHGLISCSNDMTVKFWSTETDHTCSKPLYTIQTDFPVARARHVPFGDKMCGIMPLRGGDNSVYIVPYGGRRGTARLQPSHVFRGHTGPVKDFLWRCREPRENKKGADEKHPTADRRSHGGDGESEGDGDGSGSSPQYQMVTWSADCDLRLWPVQQADYPDFQYRAGQRRPPECPHPSEFDYRSFRPEPASSYDTSMIIRHHATALGGGAGYAAADDRFNHFNWISGIRIGQAAFRDGTADPTASAAASADGKFSNLAEEVCAVGHQFPQLRFERISVSTGNLVITLNGPWSSDNAGEPTFIRVGIKFPRGYPCADAKPKFSIERTHELADSTRRSLLARLAEIADKYCDAGRFCLEACMRYLLGEEEPEWGESGADEGADDGADGKTAEKAAADAGENTGETPETPATLAVPGPKAPVASQGSPTSPVSPVSPALQNNPFLPLSPTVSASSVSSVSSDELATPEDARPAFDSTPVPKNCGAIWTPSGHLVCFFNYKQQKHQPAILFGSQGFSLVNPIHVGGPDDDAGDASETADWAAAATGGPTRGAHRAGPVDMSGAQDSGLSTGASSSSSSSPSLADDLDLLQYDRLYQRRVPRSSTGDVKTSPVRSTADAVANTVTIHSFTDEIPAKMILAYGYRVLGDSRENLARHNANVAQAAGCPEIAESWRLLSILLASEVSPGGYTGSYTENNPGNTGGITGAAPAQFSLGFSASNPRARFFWGNHPFGGAWLAWRMMDYYEQLGDIQMLAMMACVLYENPTKEPRPELPPNDSYMTDPGPLPPRQPIVLQPQMMRSMSTVSSVSMDSFRSGSGTSADPLPGLPENPTASPAAAATPAITPAGTPPAADRVTVAGGAEGGAVESRERSIDASNPLPPVLIQLQNTDTLDLLRNVPTLCLEGLMDQGKLRMYRAEYASLLFLWGLPNSRVKVLKFNYDEDTLKRRKNGGIGSSTDEYMEHVGLVGWIEQGSDNYIRTPHWQKRLLTTKQRQRRLQTESKVCQYCLMTVHKQVTVCPVCNHVMHSQCAMKWWDEQKMSECPSGCGCHCHDVLARERERLDGIDM